MRSNIIFLKPYLKPTVWGGTHLNKYGVRSNKKIGEAWLVSAINHCESQLKNTNVSLSTFFKANPAFFNHPPYHTYPLLLKLLDCNDNLSIQVHPQNKLLEKNEAWYFLQTNKNSKIICGHKARSKKDFMQKYNTRAWDKLLSYLVVKKEDIVYIPTGTLHALLKGVVILEIQQPSDTTYRLYDYDRELTNPKRKLHVKEALTNINYSSTSIKQIKNGHLLTPYFALDVIDNIKSKTYSFNADWLQCFVVEGKATINNIKIKKGDCFLLSHKWTSFTIIGKIKMIITYIKKKNG